MTWGPLETIATSFVTGVVAIFGTVLTYRVNCRRANTDDWSKLHEKMDRFQEHIRSELTNVERERNELRKRVDCLETQVRTLIAQNEKLMLEKLDWMQRATSLQLLLQKAMQTFPLNTNTSLVQWLDEELGKLQHKPIEEKSDGIE